MNYKQSDNMKTIIILGTMLVCLSCAGCAGGEGNNMVNELPGSTNSSGTGSASNGSGSDSTSSDDDAANWFSERSTVAEVVRDAAFGDFGRLLFPVDRDVRDNMTLAQVSTSSVYVWYNYIRAEKTVEIINRLKSDALQGRQIFYRFYSDAERQANPDLSNTGLFFFHGDAGEPFGIFNAGGGFMYVGAMQDSFPHALEVSKKGYNAFALIYRPDYAYDDLARAIAYIHANAEKLGVSPNDYSLWGGSAGARMAAYLGNRNTLAQYGLTGIPQAAAVIMQYTGYSSTSRQDAPTYACVGSSDGIASWRTMQSRLQTLASYGIPTEFHAYNGLPHGFGIGQGTIAEGWIDDAVKFWENQMKNHDATGITHVKM